MFQFPPKKLAAIIFLLAASLFARSLFCMTLESVADLQKDALLSEQTRRPIFLYVASIGCTYCKRLEKDIISPMIKSTEYDNKILMRKILWEESMPIIDFEGERMSAENFLLKYNIMATPSILFLDKNGNEIVKRLDGYRSPDLFWHYLDSSVNKAVKVLKK